MCLLRTLPRIYLHFTKNTKNYISSNTFSKVSYSTKKYDLDLTIRGVSLQNYIKQLEREYQQATQSNFASKHQVSELQPIIAILNERKTVVDNLKSLEELLNEKDDDVRKLAEEEKMAYENEIQTIDQKLLNVLLPSDRNDECRSIVLEVNSGVGGQEAMLFAGELFEMYTNFAEHQGWETQIADYTTTDLGGIRHGSLLINGNEVFRYLKHEAGVHRVQRIPTTEKAGRIHTSTVSVIVLPQPTDIEINIENKDLRIETKRASGAGGQHVNTTDSAVRIVHIPTGVTVECQVDRSQIKNRQIAMTKLRALLYHKEMETQEEKTQSLRKSQVRSNFRNEKIRTYNFPQDRVTDHRLQGCNVHNLRGFMQGNDALGDLINKLDEELRIESLLRIVNKQ